MSNKGSSGYTFTPTIGDLIVIIGNTSDASNISCTNADLIDSNVTSDTTCKIFKATDTSCFAKCIGHVWYGCQLRK